MKGALFQSTSECIEQNKSMFVTFHNVDVSYHIPGNHLLLFAFSCVSEHYARRFDQFLGKRIGQLSNEQKIDRVMASFHQFLG